MVKLRTCAHAIKFIPFLQVAWVIYLVALRYFDKDRMPMDKFQMDDIFFIFKNREVCLNRARGASKTRDMALLAVFYQSIPCSSITPSFS